MVEEWPPDRWTGTLHLGQGSGWGKLPPPSVWPMPADTKEPAASCPTPLVLRIPLTRGLHRKPTVKGQRGPKSLGPPEGAQASPVHREESRLGGEDLGWVCSLLFAVWCAAAAVSISVWLPQSVQELWDPPSASRWPYRCAPRSPTCWRVPMPVRLPALPGPDL